MKDAIDVSYAVTEAARYLGLSLPASINGVATARGHAFANWGGALSTGNRISKSGGRKTFAFPLPNTSRASGNASQAISAHQLSVTPNHGICARW